MSLFCSSDSLLIFHTLALLAGWCHPLLQCLGFYVHCVDWVVTIFRFPTTKAPLLHKLRRMHITKFSLWKYLPRNHCVPIKYCIIANSLRSNSSISNILWIFIITHKAHSVVACFYTLYNYMLPWCPSGCLMGNQQHISLLSPHMLILDVILFHVFAQTHCVLP
jgi:hypothetical protein